MVAVRSSSSDLASSTNNSAIGLMKKASFLILSLLSMALCNFLPKFLKWVYLLSIKLVKAAPANPLDSSSNPIHWSITWMAAL